MNDSMDSASESDLENVTPETMEENLREIKEKAVKNLRSLVLYELIFLSARDFCHGAAILQAASPDKDGNPQQIPTAHPNDIKQIEPTLCHKCKRNVAAGRFLLHYQKCKGPKIQQYSTAITTISKEKSRRKTKTKKGSQKKSSKPDSKNSS